MKHVDYIHKLNKYVVDQASSSTSASGTKALPTGRVLYDNLESLFYIEHEVKHLFTIQTYFFIYTEIDETLKNLQRHKLPKQK